jgi:GNAT superfamily N-acetyltransferase
MKFSLSPISIDDMDELVRMQLLSFAPSEMHTALFGYGEKAKAKAKTQHLHDLKHDHGNVWLKLTDVETGRIVSFSNWRVFPTLIVKEPEPIKVDWFDDPADIESAEEILVDYMGRRKKYMTEPHVLLYILFTDPEMQGKGAGEIMVRWGCDLADRMFLPMWVEASEYGRGLYKKCGFEDVEDVVVQTKSFRSAYVLMKRERKVEKMEMERKK